MYVPNFSSLAGLEVADKFVVVVVGWWNTWLLCLIGRSENQNSQKIKNGECFFVSWYIRNKEK